jgi:predicted CXXCH cytochrome family protein
MDLTMMKNGKNISLYINPGQYKQSTHGGFDCKDCHEGYNPEEIPHTTKKVDINCKNCHDNLKGLENSVHKKSDCNGCHNPHYQKPVKEISKANFSEQCLTCHAKKNIRDYTNSKHSRVNVGCDGCHNGGHQVKNVSKSEINRVCGKCHGKSISDLKNSVHHTVFGSGNKNAPDCVDCHGSHNIISSKMTIESQACLKCHLDEKLFPGEDKGSARFVARYKTSIHSSIQKNGKPAAGCVDCHGDHMIESTKDPQKSTVKAKMIETCGKCHGKEVEHYKKSAHGETFKNGNPDSPDCSKCHGEHSINSVLQSDEFSKINQTELCLSCHKDNKVNKNKNTHLDEYKNSFHYIALKNGNLNAATCSNCHGPHEMKTASDTASQINKKNIEATCGQTNCHIKQREEYTGSIHQTSMLNKENSDSPTCNSCHGAHQVITTDSLGNTEGSKQRGIIQLCSSCHASVELRKNNNLPNVTGTYLESFHGLAIRGGSKLAADCGSCHGNHNIRPSSDPLSSINKQNLSVTCGKCHPGASEVFINTRIHMLGDDDNPLLYWISKFYIFLIVAVIGGMVLHNVLDFRRKLKEKKLKSK